MECKRPNHLEGESEDLLDKMKRLMEHPDNCERVFKLDKKLLANVKSCSKKIKLMEQEVRSDLLIGVNFTDKKKLINMKSQRERIIEEARRKSLLSSERGIEQKVKIL
jgi:4-aminobutyrate aminotransferase-like enzyme